MEVNRKTHPTSCVHNSVCDQEKSKNVYAKLILTLGGDRPAFNSGGASNGIPAQKSEQNDKKMREKTKVKTSQK